MSLETYHCAQESGGLKIYMTIPEGYTECVEPFKEKEALKLERQSMDYSKQHGNSSRNFEIQ